MYSCNENKGNDHERSKQILPTSIIRNMGRTAIMRMYMLILLSLVTCLYYKKYGKNSNENVHVNTT